MYQGQLNTEQIQQLIKPLVVSGIYKNETSALNEIVIEFVKNKLKDYNTIAEKFELKYKNGFNEFTANIKNTASIAEEDDWMEWKAAMEMKVAWSETLKTMMQNANQH
ncbi:MAG: hypothetical protein B6D64_03390 [Bacteroidetes bacterium 4484_276]|nr:MAG: hypothetical protein B6D64_03390 [Bacteroidetes bacterium 4484_276]OYT13285.1 MAG: hypothetical protein B6I19_05965 [Bacteroidetes bacterium 4572_114]